MFIFKYSQNNLAYFFKYNQTFQLQESLRSTGFDTAYKFTTGFKHLRLEMINRGTEIWIRSISFDVFVRSQSYKKYCTVVKRYMLVLNYLIVLLQLGLDYYKHDFKWRNTPLRSTYIISFIAVVLNLLCSADH